MSAYLTKEQELEARIERLEATVNKSNFSEGLALSLENIEKNIKEQIDILNKSELNYSVPGAMEIILTSSIKQECLRLRQKG